MKEKEIVDFTKLKKNEEGDYLTESGEEIGCGLCYTHEKAYEKLRPLQENTANPDGRLFHYVQDVGNGCRSGITVKEMRWRYRK